MLLLSISVTKQDKIVRLELMDDFCGVLKLNKTVLKSSLSATCTTAQDQLILYANNNKQIKKIQYHS